MPKAKEQKIILAVAAHPDDIDFSSGGTIAKWVKEGAWVYYLILTDGSKGSSNPQMTPGKLAAIRRLEQLNAAKILGVKKVFFLNHKDGELKADLKLKKQITQKIRELKPTAVLTFNPTILFSVKANFINHTDHREAGLATIDSVFPFARDRLTFPDHEKKGLKPHKVRELYLVSFDEANYVSDIEKTFDLKLAAISAHATQINEKTTNRLKDWARKTGQEHGLKYAEQFIKLELS